MNTSTLQQTATTRPVDFLIETQSAFNTFIKNTKNDKNAYTPSNALKLCLSFASNLKIGTMDVILPDGKKIRFQGQEKGPHGILLIHNDRVARKFLTGGRLGFCEAYLDGDWSSPDIAQFFELILNNSEIMRKTLHGKKWYRALSYIIHLMKPNSKQGSRKNIYSHYDIGNNFYKEWLDPSMTYSSALWHNDEETLQQAQQNKYANLAKMLGIKSDDHVLEIGCGWGGFAEYVAKKIGAKVTGITISKEQFDFATKRIKDAGLDDKVSIVMQDYRDMKGKFDHIASIEMFEAVGEKYWPTYFSKIEELLKPGGKAGLQIITIDDDHFPKYRKSADYIQRYIFPGGMLPSVKALKSQTSNAQLKWEDLHRFGKDYAKTLNLWNAGFQKAWPKFNTQFDARFKRLWEQYLAYCEAGFNAGTIDVVQLTLSK